VRDRLAASQRDWLETLTTAIRIAIEERHFRPDVDARQLAHEILTLAYGHELIGRLLPEEHAHERLRAAVDRLIAGARTQTRTPPSRT
jgi:hypothetical protein